MSMPVTLTRALSVLLLSCFRLVAAAAGEATFGGTRPTPPGAASAPAVVPASAPVVPTFPASSPTMYRTVVRSR